MAYMGTFAQCASLALMRSMEDDEGYMLMWKVRGKEEYYAQRIKVVTDEAMVNIVGISSSYICMTTLEFRELMSCARARVLEEVMRNDS